MYSVFIVQVHSCGSATDSIIRHTFVWLDCAYYQTLAPVKGKTKNKLIPDFNSILNAFLQGISEKYVLNYFNKK